MGEMLRMSPIGNVLLSRTRDGETLCRVPVRDRDRVREMRFIWLSEKRGKPAKLVRKDETGPMDQKMFQEVQIAVAWELFEQKVL